MYIFFEVFVTTLQKKQFFSRINKITSNYLKLGTLLAKLLKIFTNPLFSEKIFDYMKRRNTGEIRRNADFYKKTFLQKFKQFLNWFVLMRMITTLA